jgi:hypothetical protein
MDFWQESRMNVVLLFFSFYFLLVCALVSNWRWRIKEKLSYIIGFPTRILLDCCRARLRRFTYLIHLSNLQDIPKHDLFHNYERLQLTETMY